MSYLSKAVKKSDPYNLMGFLHYGTTRKQSRCSDRSTRQAAHYKFSAAAACISTLLHYIKLHIFISTSNIYIKIKK